MSREAEDAAVKVVDAPRTKLRDDASRLCFETDSTLVDEVLAFIDDSEDILIESCETAATASKSSTKTKPSGCDESTHRTLTFRQRQQAEITRLRSQVLHLEDQLLEARNRDVNLEQDTSVHDDGSYRRQHAEIVSKISPNELRLQPYLTKLWKSMVTRHKQLAVASQLENRRLRELVNAHDKEIREIRRILRRLARRQAEIAGPVPRPVFGGATQSTIYHEDAVVAKLCSGIAQLYKTFDLSFQLNGLQNVDALPLHESVHQLNSTTSIAQIVYSHPLPFGFRDTWKALWDSPEVLCREASAYHDRREIQWDGRMLRAYRIDYMNTSKQMGMAGFHVLGLFAEDRRTIAIDSCAAYPVRADGARVNGVTYQEQGRVLVSNVADDTVDLCRVQLSLDLQIEIEPTVPDGQALSAEFRDMVVQHKSKVLKDFVQELEHTLLVN